MRCRTEFNQMILKQKFLLKRNLQHNKRKINQIYFMSSKKIYINLY